jgi:hypothetical protein
MTNKLQTIGRCVDDAVKEATEEWFRQHGGMRDREEAFTNGIKLISASVELHLGGKVAVHVVITARSERQNHVDYQKYQREPGNGYVRVLKPLK